MLNKKARNIVSNKVNKKEMVRYTYIFLIIISLVGFISGFFYYKVQTKEVKTEIKETINLEESFSSGYNNVLKRTKKIGLIFIFSIFIITVVFNIGTIFIESFSMGFIFSFLSIYSIKMALIYVLFYIFIPLLFIVILIRIGLSITVNIVKCLMKRERMGKIVKILGSKYLIIGGTLLVYEFLLSIFSYNINTYLMTFI